MECISDASEVGLSKQGLGVKGASLNSKRRLASAIRRASKGGCQPRLTASILGHGPGPKTNTMRDTKPYRMRTAIPTVTSRLRWTTLGFRA